MNKQKANGFSLLEIILYIGLAAIILASFTVLSISWLNLRTKTQAVYKINNNALLILETITHLVKTGQTINQPLAGQTSEQIEIETATQIVKIYKDGDSLYYLSGTTSPQSLVEKSVKVDNFSVFRPNNQNNILKINLALSFGSTSTLATSSWQTSVCQR